MVCWLWLAAAVALGAPAPTPAPADGLRQKLEVGRPVRIIVLGDSISAGMHLPDPTTEGYPVLFRRMLEARFPKAQLRLLNYGVIGASTTDGLALFESQLGTGAIDLCIFQYGGNDKGSTDGLDRLADYEANLRRLVAAARARGAACLIMTPPMHEPVAGMPYPVAVKRVAASLGVPVADIDTALKAGPHDYRGVFPYFMHPREYEHAILARTLYGAFCELLGESLTIDLPSPATVLQALPGSRVEIPVGVRNRGRDAAIVRASIEGAPAGPATLVEAGQSGVFKLPLYLPPALSGGRSMEWPVWLSAWSPGQTVCWPARVAVSPMLNLPRAGTPFAERPVATLGGPHLLFGHSKWRGPADLSADVYLAWDDEAVRLKVVVADEVVQTAGAPLSDGLELFLDLRPEDQRGSPVFGRQCVSLFVSPPATGKQVQVSGLIEDEPPASFLTFPVTYAATAAGYTITVDLPRRLLDEVGGRRVTSFGFDLALDDSDDQTRETQLMWFGRADNFVNPRRLADLRLEDAVPPGTVRVAVF